MENAHRRQQMGSTHPQMEHLEKGLGEPDRRLPENQLGRQIPFGTGNNAWQEQQRQSAARQRSHTPPESIGSDRQPEGMGGAVSQQGQIHPSQFSNVRPSGA